MATTRKLEKFFSSELVSLSKRLQKEEKRFFPPQPDPEASSYYVERTKRKMTREDFEEANCKDFADLATRLARLWNDQGHPELARLAPKLSELARQAYSLDEQDDEVSPFIYVMY